MSSHDLFSKTRLIKQNGTKHINEAIKLISITNETSYTAAGIDCWACAFDANAHVKDKLLATNLFELKFRRKLSCYSKSHSCHMKVICGHSRERNALKMAK